ncbi:MAG: CHAT domain-containing protein [Nostoc sp. S4]|nr:CHAT domain-containing protein [Nostoc sp. S4]
MKKLVILKFDGNFESGFQVNLEIANEEHRAYFISYTTNLPENISTSQILNNWHEIYCSLDSQFRIKSGGSSRGNLESLKQECKRESINLVASFNQWLNAPSFTFIANSIKELNPQDEIRIIIITSCHELRQLPWHLWDVLTELPLVEVALSSPNAERGERPYREKIRILIILGDHTEINIHQDKQYLQSFCGNDAEIILLQQPSRKQLNNYLQDNLGWDILFFSGHSQTQGMQGRIYLNDSDSLTMAELRDALQVAIQKRLQIAFFNSCDGLGIAYELKQLNIPQVIVMREPVPDKVAQEFLNYLVQQFTSGKSLYISVRNARLELQKLESDFPCASWLPVIVQNQTETPPTWQSLGIISFCPYQGLEKFTEEKAKYFFGRDKATSGLVAAVNNRPLVAVIGASGSGKSSLVFAGLIPQLRRDTVNNWLIIAFRPGKNPFESLAVALVSALNLPEDERRLVELELDINLKGDRSTLENFIANLTDGDRLGEDVTRVLLIADQFEEIYTLCTESESRKTFLDSLLQAVKNAPFFTLVLTLRADFLSRALDDYEPFGRALQEYQLEPVVRMSREELEQAITHPATQLGFEFERGLSNTIINDIQDGDGRLPLLEFTLTQLWKQQHSGRLTHQAYKNIGGVEKALANYADAVYAQLSDSERKKAQRVFIQLVQPGEGTEDTRKLATIEDVKPNNWNLVTYLADKRLVVTNRNESTNEETVEVVHEALIRHWERLRRWMQENRRFRIWQQGLIVALQQWMDSNKDDGALLRGATLAVAEDWLKQRGGEVSKVQRRFIEKSVGLQERERKQKQRLRRRIIAGLAGALLLSLSLAGFGWWQWQEARIRGMNTSILSIEAFLTSKLDLEALTEAVRIAKDLQKNPLGVPEDTKIRTVITLQKVVYGVRELNRKPSSLESTDSTEGNTELPSLTEIPSKPVDYYRHTGNSNIDIYGFEDGKIKIIKKDRQIVKTINTDTPSCRTCMEDIKLSPDGKTFISFDKYSGEIKLWSIDGEEIQIFKGHEENLNYWPLRGDPLPLITDVNFSPDSKTIVSSGLDGKILLWSKDSAEPQIVKNNLPSVQSVEFSLDGNTLTSINSDGMTQIWSVNGKKLQSLELEGEEGNSLSFDSIKFSYDGNNIIAGGYDSPLTLWNKNGKLLRKFDNDYGSTSEVKFSLNGNIISGGGGGIRIWSKDGKLLKSFKAFEQPTFSYQTPRMDFSLNGNIAVVNNAAIELWNQDGKLQKTIKEDDTYYQDISFSPDGNIIASISDKRIELWSKGGKLLQSIEDNGYIVDFSLNGNIIASADGRRINFWSKDGKLLGKGHSVGSITSISFSSKSDIIASGDDEGIIKIWNKEGKELQTIKTPSQIKSLSLSPDGKTLIYSGDKVILLHFDLDDLLKKGCDWLHDYLKNNRDVSAEDRRLCDNIKR